MIDEQSYLIPQAISLRYELFPGWGWPEVRVVLSGILLGGLAFGNASWVWHAPEWARLVSLVWPAAVGYFLAVPGFHGTSFWVQGRTWLHFRQQPQLWIYDWQRSE